MTEHGSRSPDGKDWFCGYWMGQDEWESIHNYSPPIPSEEAGPADSEEAGEIDEDTGEE
ncbi:MAG: hypothetical protein ABI361_04525 [Nitrososphaera sp.]|jgi:hypothetical protein